MGHDHHHHHHHHKDQSITNLKRAFFLNLTFTVIEIVGGIYTNSLAILSDALHDFGDSIGLGLSWYFQKLSKKKKDATFSYGYKRFSLLGAIINSIVLVIGSVIIITTAIPRIIAPQVPDSLGMIWFAIAGVIFNGLAVLQLQKGTSINERVVALHLIEDVLGWVAVLIGSLIIHFTDYYIIDPLLSLAIALFILFNVYKNLKESLVIILQGVPKDVDVDHIKAELFGFPLVSDIHDLHVWTMDGEFNVLSMHIVIQENRSLNELSELKNQIRQKLDSLPVHHITIEVESPEEHPNPQTV